MLVAANCHPYFAEPDRNEPNRMDALTELLCAYMTAQGSSTAHLAQALRVNRKPMSTYTSEFMVRAPHMQKCDVTAYRNWVLKNGPFIDETVAPDLIKSNKRAADVRQAGNRLYLAKEYTEALEKYNESICWADGPDSEDLGIGYANRSAIYYDMGEYELGLANIALAKKHNYPQRLMPKLLARELNCREKITNGQSRLAMRCPSLAMKVEPDPKIPYMAAGIVEKELPTYGRSLMAERPFKAGDVILTEKAWMAAISPELKYKNCNHCSIDNFHSLIPCPNCVSVMYCSEKCREENYRVSHRFECGISEKLHHISYGSSRVFMGPRSFFYGLTLFGDDLKDMMDFCQANGRTGANPLSLDYTSYDPLQEFKIFHKVKLPTDNFLYEDSFRFYAAVYYSVYIKQPLVRSLVATKPQRDFMLRCFLDYMRIIGFLIIGPRQNFTNQLFSIASVCNHSCDPNTLAAVYCNQLKLITLRPIAAGEQIQISYGPLARQGSDAERRQALTMYHFDCICDCCDAAKARLRKAAAKKLPSIPLKNLMAVNQLLEDDDADDAAKLTMLQQFAERYAYTYPKKHYLELSDLYRKVLNITFDKEVQDRLRNGAVEQK
ncbi:SET and MYND domain-containing protein 4 [Aedes albopictus]|uniref:MYND-type domain-containing protein n=1 Tax=Aedes albopictus TaxID=7160 RepID=A0ABM1ZCK2_AEDAL